MDTKNQIPTTPSMDTRAVLPAAHPTAFSRTLRRTIAAVGLSAMLFSACGNDGDPVSAGSASGEDAEIVDETLSDEDGATTAEELAEKAGELTQPVELPVEDGEDIEDALTAEGSLSDGVSGDVAREDIIDPQPWFIDDASADPANDQVLIVTYMAGSPPCTQAFVEVAESSDAVTVSLFVGLHPDMAAMSCLAVIAEGEIEVSLNAPLGDRTVEINQP